MHHRLQRTLELLGLPTLDVYDDVFCGSDYLSAFTGQKIKPDDIVVLLSMDGAQLYASKSSDCWFLIWVLFDLEPGLRYKKRYVLPAAVIGGPNKLKNADSFAFPSLYHVSAIQREKGGLPIWDAANQKLLASIVHIILKTADSPGLTYLTG